MKGIDIASYQTSVDFKKVKNSGIEIVYIKATEGLTYENPLLKSQYNGAKSAGLKIGFYHFLRNNDPVLEAKHFLSAIVGFKADCRDAIDIESGSGGTITHTSSNVRLFADYLILKGRQVCLYTNDYFYANNLNNSVKNIPLWVAHYGAAKPNAVNYIGFQYTDTGSVNGISGPIDLSEFKTAIFVGPIPPINLVVQSFQHATNLVGLRDKNGNKLVEDGIIGIHTNEVIAKVFVDYGDHNELVRWIQRRLVSLGFSVGKTGADSYFGVNTLAGVKKFQASRGLVQDGIVGPLTTNALLK